jgi:hypothetical protein
MREHDQVATDPGSTAQKRRAFRIGGVWALAVVAALLVTLPSVRNGDNFDGLNNAFQIPLALPWFVLPIYTGSNFSQAFVDAGWGVLNACVLTLWLAKRRRPSRRSLR